MREKGQTHMDDGELARVRTIPLAAVLEGLGARRDPHDPKRNWRLGGSRITVTGERFYDHNAAGASHRLRGQSGGGGAIDALMYLRDLSFHDAVRELGGWNLAAVGRATSARGVEASHCAPSSNDAPRPDPRQAERVRKYLVAERAIPEDVVRLAMESGKVFADRYANAVFRLTDDRGMHVGFELRGTWPGSAYHGVRGSKGLFVPLRRNTPGVPEATFVESGIDALSYQALNPARLVFSTTGDAVALPVRMAQHLADRGYRVFAGFDADAQGDRMAQRLAEALPGRVERDRPDTHLGKDWNAVLRAKQRLMLHASARVEDALIR